MDTENNRRNTLLEEYKQLRLEIITIFQKEGTNLNYSILLSLGVIGLMEKISTASTLILINSFIILYLWKNDMSRRRRMFRIGSYIQVFIESELEELRWESASKFYQDEEKNNETRKSNRIIRSNKFSSNTGMCFLVISLINYFIGISFTLIFNENITLSSKYVVSIVLISLYFILVALNIKNEFRIVNSERERTVQKWKDIKLKYYNKKDKK